MEENQGKEFLGTPDNIKKAVNMAMKGEKLNKKGKYKVKGIPSKLLKNIVSFYSHAEFKDDNDSGASQADFY